MEIGPEWGKEILVSKAERASKICRGMDKYSGRWVFYHPSQTIHHEGCLIKYYKIFKNYHPAEMNEPEFSFYFRNKHHQNPDYSIHHKRSPLGKNEIG